jgi:hypothetical protein
MQSVGGQFIWLKVRSPNLNAKFVIEIACALNVRQNPR